MRVTSRCSRSDEETALYYGPILSRRVLHAAELGRARVIGVCNDSDTLEAYTLRARVIPPERNGAPFAALALLQRLAGRGISRE